MSIPPPPEPVDGRPHPARPWRLAIGLDVVALVLLAVIAVEAWRSDFAGMLLLSLLGVPLALVAAIASGRALVRTRGRVPRWAAIGLAIVLTAAVVPTGAVVIAAARTAAPNPARDAADRLAAVVTSAGGHRICGQGDPGRGPDNLQPWYDELLTAPANDRLRQRLVDRANRLGWIVSTDDAYDFQRRPTPRVDIDTALEEQDACSFGDRRTAAAGWTLVRIRTFYPYRNLGPEDVQTPTTPPEH
ncbi:hypothetical protein [Amnibacterium sp.]|uniref:hypothetical protein n=1 Tax=Amnibacterium sp. TaxID=1872496 RepID=UPI003F7C7EF8